MLAAGSIASNRARTFTIPLPTQAFASGRDDPHNCAGSRVDDYEIPLHVAGFLFIRKLYDYSLGTGEQTGGS